MATSLLALLDDIATLLDDVGTLTQSATKQTAGVLGDDLALNAEQVTGVRPERELTVVWSVFKGSALNKVLLVPGALVLSAVTPWIITPLLMFGGAFLCFEGFEKVGHKFLHSRDEDDRKKKLDALIDPKADLAALERDKIKGAIRTDFILSAEIVVIALGTVQTEPFWTKAAVLASVAALVTVGVYLLVAAIVKIDDLGLRLKRESATFATVGSALLWTAPRLLKALSVLGTAAMFLVGGGILAHGIPWVHHFIHGAEVSVLALPHVGQFVGALVPTLLTGTFGLVAGALITALVVGVARLRNASV